MKNSHLHCVDFSFLIMKRTKFNRMLVKGFLVVMFLAGKVGQYPNDFHKFEFLYSSIFSIFMTNSVFGAHLLEWPAKIFKGK